MAQSIPITVCCVLLSTLGHSARAQDGAQLQNEACNILANAGLAPSSIPVDSIQVSDPIILDLAHRWSTAQEPLEKLFQARLKLDFRPKLHLVIRETLQDGEWLSYLVVTDPGDEKIVEILSRALNLPKEFFDPGALLYGETSNYSIDEFKPRLVTPLGRINMMAAQGVVMDLLQSDPQLEAAAKKVGGAFKPVRWRRDRGANYMFVVTAWQSLGESEGLRLFWRANVRLEQFPDSQSELETVIEIGQLRKSQSLNQIRIITNSNQMLAFDTRNASASVKAVLGEVNVVRYKEVQTAAETALTPEFRKQLTEMAPILWNKIKDALLQTHK